MKTNVNGLDLTNDAANMVAGVWMERLGLRLGRTGIHAAVDNQIAIQRGEATFDILEYVSEHPEIGEVERPLESPIPDDFARRITGHANRAEALVDALRSLWLGDSHVQAKLAAAGITLTDEQLRRVVSEDRIA
jgi:hypothetical protein